jgi:YHS domain-containing protein
MVFPGAIIVRALVIGAIAVSIVTFGPNDGRNAYANSEHEPEPTKPADTKPLPPRPTEYPRGLTEKPKPGEAIVPEPKAPDHAPAADAQHPTAAEPGKIQPMPAPVAGTKPEDASKPDEGTIPKAGDLAARTAHWVPPKRYHFVMDALTGLAMGGIDPVAFFVDGELREGIKDHELDWGGTTWHFVNDGNLSAFKLNPEVYAPRFGGRCAFGLSQGLLVEGQPQFFVIHRDRLYLFANAGYRAAFLSNPDALAAEAEREWPLLTRGQP